MLKCKQVIFSFLMVGVLLSQNICFAEAKESDMQKVLPNSIITESVSSEYGERLKEELQFIESVDLGNGVICDVYEDIGSNYDMTTYSAGVSIFASETFLPVTHYFYINVNGIVIGYLRQTTNWYYNNTTRPRLTGQPSDTLCTYDESPYFCRMLDGGYKLEDYSDLSTMYTRIGTLECDGTLVGTHGYSTIVSSTGNASFVAN